ncbi:MAG: hypothetical protein AAF514_22145, partial [Verrucomicrobiota bacterium]
MYRLYFIFSLSGLILGLLFPSGNGRSPFQPITEFSTGSSLISEEDKIEIEEEGERTPFAALLDDLIRMKTAGSRELQLRLERLDLNEPGSQARAETIIRRWARVSPQDAFAYLRKRGDLRSGAYHHEFEKNKPWRELVHVLMDEWASLDWRAATEGAIAFKNESSILPVMDGLSDGLPPDKAFAAFELLRGRMGDASEITPLFRAMGLSDPTRALDLSLQFGDLALQTATGAVMDSRGPTELLQWADRQDKEFYKGIEMNVFSAWARVDPVAALRACWPLNGSPTFSIELKSAEEVQTCLKWVNDEVESPEVAADLINGFLFQVPQMRTPGAALNAVQGLDPVLQEASQYQIRRTIETWVQEDNDSAQQWLDALEEGWLKDVADEASYRYASMDTELLYQSINSTPKESLS